MKNEKFIGTGVAVITPFTAGGQVDEKALEQILNSLIYGGVEYLVILGTTGESVTLTNEEKQQVIDIAKDTIDLRVPFMLGVGGNNTYEIAKTLEKSDFTGIDAILSVSPYYNKPTQKGIIEHYKYLAAASPLPILLYNVPGRTSSNILAETTLQIAREVENIFGIKEASGNFDQCMRIIKEKPADFLVISGDDNYTLPYISMGMDGVISVVANAYPKEYSNMVRAALKNDFETARKLHYQLLDIMSAIFAEGNPGGIKALLEIKGLCQNELRMPLAKISDELYSKIKKLNAEIS